MSYYAEDSRAIDEYNTDVSSYSLSELMMIVGLTSDDMVNPRDIRQQTEALMRENAREPRLVAFFADAQSELLQYYYSLHGGDEDSDVVDTAEEEEEEPLIESFNVRDSGAGDALYPAGEKQIMNWWENEALEQEDSNQTNKITQRKQKIEVFGNTHVPMNRQQIATTDTFGVPVKQDSLNPNLKNTITRFVNLDSQFRQYTNGTGSSSTDYTLDLSDTLRNALSLRLYSFQIPFSWYAIDEAYGNTCLWIYDEPTGKIVAVSVASGNYTQLAFQTQLNTAFAAAGFTFGAGQPVEYNANSGKITLKLFGGVWSVPGDEDDGFIISPSTYVIFFDFAANLQCTANCTSKSSHYMNNTLGWIMGYREPNIRVVAEGNPAPAILDLNGTKYLILSIDDYNQNHVNNSLVSITQYSNTLKMPTYYSPDIPYTCIQPVPQYSPISTFSSSGAVVDPVVAATAATGTNGLLVAGKYEHDYTATQVVLPSAPRTLTNAQLYTINSVNANNNNLTNYLSKAPTSSDIMAILPVKTSVGVPTGSLLVEFSGSLQDNKRTYFGPVNIERMKVQLMDDKGNVLNMNGVDWCVTLVCECLYQY